MGGATEAESPGDGHHSNGVGQVSGGAGARQDGATPRARKILIAADVYAMNAAFFALAVKTKVDVEFWAGREMQSRGVLADLLNEEA